MIAQKAYAKINIGLDIKGLREDKYHEIDTIMQSVELGDRITFTEKEKGIHFWCDDSSIKQNKNTAYIAAKLFMQQTGIKKGVKIDVYKSIPNSAGLGGGSTDAAAVLRGLNFLFKTNFSSNKLEEMGAQIGADVPFCIRGGTQRARGIGEKLEPLKDFNDVWFVIIKPQENVDTTWAYKEYDRTLIMKRPDMDEIQKIVEKRDLTGMKDKIINVFQEVVTPHKAQIQQVLADLLHTEAITAFMTGSGSAVAAVYNEMGHASKAYQSLSGKYVDTFITKTAGMLL